MMGDGSRTHVLNEHPRKFRKKDGKTYAEGHRAGIVCGTCGFAYCVDEYASMHLY